LRHDGLLRFARNDGEPARRVNGRGDGDKEPREIIAQPSFCAVIPGWSEGPDPESRDSGFALARAPE